MDTYTVELLSAVVSYCVDKRGSDKTYERPINTTKCSREAPVRKRVLDLYKPFSDRPNDVLGAERAYSKDNTVHIEVHATSCYVTFTRGVEMMAIGRAKVVKVYGKLIPGWTLRLFAGGDKDRMVFNEARESMEADSAAPIEVRGQRGADAFKLDPHTEKIDETNDRFCGLA